MDNPRTLEATAYKEGKWWMISIPEIDGLSQAKTVESVPGMAADLAAIVLNVPQEAVRVNITYRLPEAAAVIDRQWHEAKAQVTTAEATAADKLAELAHTLKANGWTLKDIAAVTGYTFQRIAQILKHRAETREEAGSETVQLVHIGEIDTDALDQVLKHEPENSVYAETGYAVVEMGEIETADVVTRADEVRRP
ncbi:hypothetical protein ACIQTZ_22965 [Paenarthrobacter sp. NPDC090520]|uniref:hypothetical protein n=1 Tax=Paenarthrobacter sp. NPDC090520 TaxID=3364382 RepID=UPI00380F8D62